MVGHGRLVSRCPSTRSSTGSDALLRSQERRHNRDLNRGDHSSPLFQANFGNHSVLCVGVERSGRAQQRDHTRRHNTHAFLHSVHGLQCNTLPYTRSGIHGNLGAPRLKSCPLHRQAPSGSFAIGTCTPCFPRSFELSRTLTLFHQCGTFAHTSCSLDRGSQAAELHICLVFSQKL